jgi:integrase
MSEKNVLNQFFFPNAHGGQLLSSSVNKVFRKCWGNAKIPAAYGNPPRVYDFRHSFATKRLHDWYSAGKDINAFLPYLSAYMGHAHLSATAYYFHLVPDFFPRTKTCTLDLFEELIPEVHYE